MVVKCTPNASPNEVSGEGVSGNRDGRWEGKWRWEKVGGRGEGLNRLPVRVDLIRRLKKNENGFGIRQ